MRHLSTLTVLFGLAAAASAADPAKGTIVVFTQAGAAKASRNFNENLMGEYAKVAAKLGAELRLVDVAREGAPPEVGLTPLVTFQNWRGRSVFQGRYADLAKVEHFVRSSRSIPQGAATNSKTNLPVMVLGRVSVGAPIKITPLQDTRPANFSEAEFLKAANGGLTAGWTDFATTETLTVRRSDRLFYFDIYPFGMDENTFVLSLAMFSQFNCHVPVFTDYGGTVSGQFANPEPAFAEAAKLLEGEAKRQMAESVIGDGFDPVAVSVPMVTWEALGLALPEKPVAAAGTTTAEIKLSQAWVYDTALVEETPPIQFRFPPPLDNYQGTVTMPTGEFVLGPGGTLEGATGFASVQTANIKMGEEDLNAHVFDLLRIKEFGESRFTLKQLESPTAGALEFGTARQFKALGDFVMKGVTLPLVANAEVTPVVLESGEPRLLVDATYSLRLNEAYEIEGPPGPDPLNDTLEFFVKVYLKPKP